MLRTISLKYYLVLGFFLLLPLFFYRLGSTALMSYDEAWYAEITRNIIQTKNPFHLLFNGQHFTDHPPFGYILMVIPTLLFGNNEFSSRFVSATLGAGSIILVFLIGKKLKNTQVGVIAGAVLLSSMWFMFRARSGNLDIPHLFFASLTVFLLLQKTKYFLYYAAISFACLFLIKTLVGVGVIPVGLYMLWMRRKEWTSRQLLQAIGIAAAIILPWYLYNQFIDTNFLYHHFFEIGARGESNGYSFAPVQQNMQYVAIGVGKWYKIFLVSVLLGVGSFIFRKKERQSWLILFTWFIGYAVFLFSDMTEIWHLIPLYPVISVIIGLGLISTIEFFGKKFYLLQYVAVAGAIFLATYQFRQFSNLIYAPEPAVFSAEKDISLKAGKFTNIYLMETFYPATVYYATQTVNPLHWNPTAYQIMIEKLQAKEDGVFIINKQLQNDLDRDVIPYTVLEQNNSYFLIQAPE